MLTTRKRIAFCCIMLLPFFSHAQDRMDSLNNFLLKVPESWQLKESETYKQYTFFGQDKSFCQVAFYAQQPSTGDKRKDFEQEWAELVEKNFTMITSVRPVTMRNKLGTTFQRFGAKGISGGNSYYIQLNVFDFGPNIQSVLVATSSQRHAVVYDSMWQSIIFGFRKESPRDRPPLGNPNPNGRPDPVRQQLVGLWGKSSSSPPAYVNGQINNMAYAGYIKGRYDLKADGTYTYQGEGWGGHLNSNEFRLADERGKYEVSGNQLILSPSFSKFRVVDRDGKVKKSQDNPLAKRTYTWQMHYYEGLQETHLILSGQPENTVDGGYSSVQQFPNSFDYGPGKILEFRFQPLK